MKAYSQKKEVELPYPPAVCSKHNKPSTKHVIVVATHSGIEQRGAFWEFGRYDRSRRKVKLFLKSSYRFVRWEARCEECQ
jgi:hypothetical protein